MLIVYDKKYFEEVKAFAEKIGLGKQLQKKLDYLDNFRSKNETECHLHRDTAPYSFTFDLKLKNQHGETKTLFNGGLIYHGNHDRGGDGGAPTYAVSLTPTHGWQIHT